MKKILLFMIVVCVMAAQARTYNFKFLRGETVEKSESTFFRKTAKREIFEVLIGASYKSDDMSEMEIRAATLMRHVSTKKNFINDIVKLCVTPDKAKKKFYVVTGIVSGTRDKATWIDNADLSSGYLKGGVIIEIYQSGKCVKHWSNAASSAGQLTLSDDTECVYVNADGYKGSKDYFDNPTKIVSADLD